MKCFVHRASDAVGVCKSCGRGLCPECLVEIETACCCRDRCEKDVRLLNEMIARGSKIYQKTSGAYLRAGLFCSATGLAFMGTGVVFGGGDLRYFFLVFGGLFVLYGVSQFFTAKNYKDR